jgi:hypothetical protein
MVTRTSHRESVAISGAGDNGDAHAMVYGAVLSSARHARTARRCHRMHAAAMRSHAVAWGEIRSCDLIAAMMGLYHEKSHARTARRVVLNGFRRQSRPKIHS